MLGMFKLGRKPRAPVMNAEEPRRAERGPAGSGRGCFSSKSRLGPGEPGRDQAVAPHEMRGTYMMVDNFS